MSLARLAIRHLARAPLRTILTVFCVATAVLAFVLLRTFEQAFYATEHDSSRDRVGTRHKISFTVHLPRHHVDVVRAVPGVRAATFANWFGVEDATDRKKTYSGLAVDHTTYLDVYDEIEVSAEDRRAWAADPRAVLVGDLLARRLGVRRGDTLRTLGRIYPGAWELRVAGIFTSRRASASRSQFLMRWDRLNEELGKNETAWHKDEVGWIVSRVADPGTSADVSRAIDARFASGGQPTLTMSESATQNGLVGMVSAVLRAVDVVGTALLGVLALLVGNAIALGVRERTREIAVLRAIGFSRTHLVRSIVTEALLMGAIGGSIGLVAAWALVAGSFGERLRVEVGGALEWFRLQPRGAGEAFVLSIVLATVAALPSALRATKRPLPEALRSTAGS